MKIIEQSDLKDIVRELKAAGKQIVFTNGCFDVLHVGHVRYLSEARKLGDILIVGLNSDVSVCRLKGPERPVNTEQDRAEVLAALTAIDYIVLFEEETAEALIPLVQPHIYVKGGDYEVKDLPEAGVVAGYGGEIVLIPEVTGKSTTNILRKLKGK